MTGIRVSGKNNGRKTYAIGYPLLAWLAASALPDTVVQLPPPDPEIVSAALAAMFLTIRHGISRAAVRAGSP